MKKTTTYALKAYTGKDFPKYVEDINTQKALQSKINSLVSLGYVEIDVIKDEATSSGTTRTTYTSRF